MTFWEATCSANENDFQTSTHKSQLDLTRNASLFYSPWVEATNNSVCKTPLALVNSIKKKNKTLTQKSINSFKITLVLTFFTNPQQTEMWCKANKGDRSTD